MKLTPVEKLPEKMSKRAPYSVYKKIEAFCRGTHRVVKIEFDDGEYINVESCYNTWHRAAQKSKFPVRIHKIKNEVYMIKV